MGDFMWGGPWMLPLRESTAGGLMSLGKVEEVGGKRMNAKTLGGAVAG